MSSGDSSLGPRLRRWIAAEASEKVAERFYPWIRDTLQDLGYDLTGPATEDDLRRTRTVLRRADVTPARMQRAAREAQRAEAEGLTALEWARSVQKRAHSKELAEGAFRRAKGRLESEFKEELSREPPSPEEAFAFLLAWEELGGSPALAALREMERQAEGALPRN